MVGAAAVLVQPAMDIIHTGRRPRHPRVSPPVEPGSNGHTAPPPAPWPSRASSPSVGHAPPATARLAGLPTAASSATGAGRQSHPPARARSARGPRRQIAPPVPSRPGPTASPAAYSETCPRSLGAPRTWCRRKPGICSAAPARSPPWVLHPAPTVPDSCACGARSP